MSTFKQPLGTESDRYPLYACYTLELVSICSDVQLCICLLALMLERLSVVKKKQ